MLRLMGKTTECSPRRHASRQRPRQVRQCPRQTELDLSKTHPELGHGWLDTTIRKEKFVYEVSLIAEPMVVAGSGIIVRNKVDAVDEARRSARTADA